MPVEVYAAFIARRCDVGRPLCSADARTYIHAPTWAILASERARAVASMIGHGGASEPRT